MEGREFTPITSVPQEDPEDFIRANPPKWVECKLKQLEATLRTHDSAFGNVLRALDAHNLTLGLMLLLNIGTIIYLIWMAQHG